MGGLANGMGVLDAKTLKKLSIKKLVAIQIAGQTALKKMKEHRKAIQSGVDRIEVELRRRSP